MKRRVYADFKALQATVLLLVSLSLSVSVALAQETSNNTTTNNSTGTGLAANTGILNNSIVGNGNQQASNTGVALNGNNTGNLNNNQNTNVVQPTAVSAPQYNAGTGAGGTAALVLPRNPLSLPNAALGRSNFGLQFGVQNNPGIGALGGGSNALGWFMQGGLNIPFGKIPAVYNTNNAQADIMREAMMDSQREVFGKARPSNQGQVQADVKGRVVGLNAYNYSTLPASKLPLQSPSLSGMSSVGEIAAPQPKVLALKVAEAFNQPLFTGEKVGSIEVGREYTYLGHTRSGWVKVLLPNGREAWTAARFEYIKFDYTEIDDLASLPAPVQEQAQSASATDASVERAKLAEASDKAAPSVPAASVVTHTSRTTSTVRRHSRRG